MIKNLIQFYRNCYLHDAQAVQVTDFFGDKVEHVHAFESFDLFNKREPFFVHTDWGEQVAKTMKLYLHEKNLMAGTFFIKGQSKMLGKKISVFCPLFLYEVSIQTDGEIFWLELIDDFPIVNPEFINYLKSHFSDLEIDTQKMLQAIPSDPFSFRGMVQMEDFFEDFFPMLDATALETLSGKETFPVPLVQAKSEAKVNDWKIINGLAVGIIPKPKGSMGILNELEILAQSNSYSKPIQNLFLPEKSSTNLKQVEVVSPALLSEQQQKIFHALESFDSTIVIGPPGTGKSFSIAALVVELIRQGRSVLVASKTDQTGKVIADKIEKDFGLKKVTVKTSKKYYTNGLKRRLSNILQGITSPNVSYSDVRSLAQGIAGLQQNIQKNQKELIARLQKEQQYSTFFSNYKNTFWQKLKKSWIRFRYPEDEPVWGIMDALQKNRQKRGSLIKELVQVQHEYRLYQTLNESRSDINNLLEAMEQDTGTLLQSYFQEIDFDIVLKALPVWICSAANIHKHLPLKKELFDVVIIDEATQCDIASTLPLLQRAKKMIIVGDPKQLRHLSFLPQKKQAALAQTYNIPTPLLSKGDYRTNSLLDLALKQINKQDQVIFLNEHFRSKPAIIRFSNEKFYENQLFLMQSTPQDHKEPALQIIQTNGTRNRKGQNLKEAQTIIQQITSILENEAALPKNACHSIGILSPFRAQVSLLKSMIRETNLEELNRHDILIGTPYHFQGEERDIMFISFVVDNQTPAGAVYYLNKPDVFNVAITRGRTLQYLVTSIDTKDLNTDLLLRQYLESATLPPTHTVMPNDVKDAFCEEVLAGLEIAETPWTIHRSWPLAGQEMDILLTHEDKNLAIDLVGYPGQFEKPVPLEYWHRLQRMGIPVFTLSYAHWYLDKETCLKALQRFMN